MNGQDLIDESQTMTIEAFADTIIPGAKRAADDRAIAGVSPTPGAVEAGALELLAWNATGVTPARVPLAQSLNAHAESYAAERGVELDTTVPPFVSLDFDDRTELVQRLLTPDNPEKDGWVLLALFCNMAYDSAAHVNLTDALAAEHPGLRAMGFALPDADGLWRFPAFSYRRKLAEPHPDTTPSGSPA